MRRAAAMIALGALLGLSACGGGAAHDRATVARCRADRSISLSQECRDARAAVFSQRFGTGHD